MEKMRVKYDTILRDEEAVFAIEQLKIINKKIADFKEDTKRRVDEMNRALETQVSKLLVSADTVTDHLETYFKTIEDPHETKTMKSYELENGKLIMNKATIKLVHNDIVIFNWAKDYKQYVKTIEELDWTSFKANLLITDDKTIVTKDTHKVMNIDGLKLTDVPEKFEVKY